MASRHLENLSTDWRTTMRPDDVAAWWAVGAWVRTTMAGALIAPTGLAMLADPAQRGLPAVAMLLGGAGLAVFAARRAARALARLEAVPDAPVLRDDPATPPNLRRRAATQVLVSP